MMDELNSNGLKAKDTFLEYKQMHPVTYGDEEKNRYGQPVLTHKEDLDSCMCLDYIIEISYESRSNASNAYSNAEDKNQDTTKLEVKVSEKPISIISESLRVNKMNVKNLNLNQDERDYHQLSDHFALSCQLKLLEEYREPLNIRETESILDVKESSEEEDAPFFDQ